VARLLALVASSLAGGLRWAVSGEMSDFTAVVALLALGAVTWKLLELLRMDGREEAYETCVRNHRRSSRSVHHVRHRIHHRSSGCHRIRHRIHQPLGSYERCGQSLSTVRLKNKQISLQISSLHNIPCSTPEIHRRIHVQHHPQWEGWCSRGRCGRLDRTCSRSCPLVPRGIHGL
jgi:hypothetical protein